MLLHDPLERCATKRPSAKPAAERVEDHVADEDAHRAGQRGPPETNDAFSREEAGGQAGRILRHEGAEDDNEDEDPEARAIGDHEVRVRLGHRDWRSTARRLAGLDVSDEAANVFGGRLRDLATVTALEFEQTGLRHEPGGIAGGIDGRDPVGLTMDDEDGAVPGAEHSLGA